MANKNNVKAVSQATRTKGAEFGGSSTSAGLGVKNAMGTSAEGPYQILKGTWKELEKIAGRPLDRKSAKDNDLAFELYTKKSEKALAQNGIEINPGNTYALHVFGQKGGVDYLKRMKSNPDGLSIDGMSKEVINGNKPFFYDESGKPRTNADSYKKVSSRVGGPDDPGAITLAKNEQKQQAVQQYRYQQQQAQERQQQDQPQEVAEEQPLEQEQQQQQQQEPQAQQEQQSELSRASNSAGLMYSGNPSANFVLPKQPEVVDGVKTSGEASMKAKTFSGGGKIDPVKNGVATRQDSIALRNDSLRMLKEYQDRGYKPTNLPFPDDDLEKALSAMQGRTGATQVIRNGVRSPEQFDPSQFRQQISPYTYRQRESASGVLNMDIQPALYDTRIKPTGTKRLMGKQGGTANDGVSIPYYGDMKISPEEPVVKVGPTPVVTPKVVSARRQPVVIQSQSAPVSAPVPVSAKRTNPYMETRGSLERDNTRVGTSFVGVDPKIARKAGMSMFADGGEINNGLLNDFNVGGTHEENPNGGINQGFDQDGTQNSVEEGETRMGDYIFSNRLKLDKADVDNLYLPKEVIGMTYADASKFINDFLEENPFDIIIKRTAESQLDSLKVGNDRAKSFKSQEEEIVAESEAPKFQFSGSQETQEPQQEEQSEQLLSSQDQELAEQQEAGQPQMAYGGYTRRFLKGGDFSQYDTVDPNGGTGWRTSHPLGLDDKSMNNYDTAVKGIGLASNMSSMTKGGKSLNLKTNKVESAGGSGGPGAGAYVAAAGTALSMGMDTFKKFDTNNLDNVISRKSTAGAAASGAVSGASAGMAFGPWGAAIGGVVGGAMGFIGAGRQNKAANKQDININGADFNKKWGDLVPDINPNLPQNTAVSAYGGRINKFDGGTKMPFEGTLSDQEETDRIKKQYFLSKGFDASGNTDYGPKTEQKQSSWPSYFMRDPASTMNTADRNEFYSKKSYSIKPKEDAVPFKMKKDGPLKYASAVGALDNFVRSRKEKARNIQSEQYSKTTTPNYFDESIVENAMAREMNNRQQVSLSTAGGSAAAARAMQYANNSEINKLKSDSYSKMYELNNAVRDKDQAETQRISEANTNVRNQDYQANLQEQDFVQGRKEKARDNLYSSVTAIGQDESNRNLAYNLSGGYKVNGTYDPEGKSNFFNSMSSIFNKKESGGLLDLYSKVTEKTKKEQALDYLTQKYNG